MNNQITNLENQAQEISLENRTINHLCMRIAQLEGNLAMVNAQNEMLLEELEKLRKEKDNK